MDLTNPEVKQAFEDLFLPAESDRTRAHLVLAGKVQFVYSTQNPSAYTNPEQHTHCCLSNTSRKCLCLCESVREKINLINK